MKTQEAVVKRIADLCVERKISVTKLAYVSGVAPSTVKNIMYGNSGNTGVVTIAKLCNGLEMSIQDFFADEVFRHLEQEIE
ncbi:MAG: helix-turn-helix transcriptional regulator [Acetatifactor sp.]|nr:helix-turn-helix transcriptional regulator [Acetatifactor sp.]